jgi:hypothetical protein
MNLDVLRSSVSFSKWQDSKGRMTLSFDVVPQGDEYMEIGDGYLFSASSYAKLRSGGRTLIKATVSITDDQDILGNWQGVHSDRERPICGSANFYTERDGRLGESGEPAKLYFTVIVEPELFAEIARTTQELPGVATINLGIQDLEYGWEPDGSHLIWKLEESKDRRPITSFSYSVEGFWTSERAISNEGDRRFNAALADSPHSEDQKLAEVNAAEKAEQDNVMVLLKQCRSLLVAILLLGVAVLAGRIV